VFGCIAYAMVHSQLRRKLDDKSEKCVFVGYSTQSKAYKLYNPVNGKVLVSRDVIFHEAAAWNWGEKQVQQGIFVEDPAFDSTPASASAGSQENSVGSSPPGSAASSPASSPISSGTSSGTGSPTSSPNKVSASNEEEPSDGQITLRRSARERKPNPKYLAAVCTSTFALLASDPIYFEEAAKEPEWCKAMEEEILAI